MPSRLKTARPIAKLRQGRNDWYRFENLANDPTTSNVYIYDEIGYFGVTAQDFVRDLQQVDAEKINLHLNTPGGEVFDGIAIYNALRSHKAEVTVHIDALAASIGSVIAMAGDRVIMAKNATMMIHDASGMVVGNAQDMREVADLLDKTSDNIASMYADRVEGTDQESWRDLMRAETWFSSAEALKAGLVDEIVDPRDSGKNDWDLSIFSYSGRDSAPDPILVPVARARNVSVDTGTTPETPPVPVFDPDVFKAAMSFAVNPPVPEEEAPFEFDPEIFRAVLEDKANNAPAVAQRPKNRPEPTFESVYDPGYLRATIQEAVSK